MSKDQFSTVNLTGKSRRELEYILSTVLAGAYKMPTDRLIELIQELAPMVYLLDLKQYETN